MATPNPINELMLASLQHLAIGQRCYNHAGDLRAAGVPVAESISDGELVQHTAAELHQKLLAAAAETDADAT
jgi:hypothetical protein